MSSFFTAPWGDRDTDRDTDSSGERYTRALVRLTRNVWHPDCSFDSALGLICETAADALRVERVNVWRYDAERNELQCLHAYARTDHSHARAGELETLPLSGDDYAAKLHEVRAIDADDVEAHASLAPSVSALRTYLSRHRIRALLDAPVRVEGELQGVICHESVDHRRQWTREEAAFAASMGDYVAMAYEIVRRRRAEHEIQHLRLHDATTDLPNRDYMVEVVTQRLAAPPSGSPVAVVHVRIDAAHGTALSAGVPTMEEVMAQVALRLRQFTNDELSLARVRADAFAFLPARTATGPDVLRLAERCISAIAAMPPQHEDIEPAAAVGIAFADDGDGDARVLMRKAEQAADRARDRGRHHYEVFDLHAHHELVESLRLERRLREAFALGHFELHYQPEYDLQQHGWTGAEALLRWRSDSGLRVAAEFIEIIEASDLILPLGRWVLQQACRDAADWPRLGNGKRTATIVRVNVAARQFDEGVLVDDVAAALAESGLPAARLCLEITETTLIRDLDHTLMVLQQLRQLGVRIAIDDFGTGYSSLTYLKRFPVDTLKIDRSFVADLPGDAVDAAIVSAVFGLASALGMEVVAEGVERIDQRDALAAIGVERMQGWLYAKAMDQASVRALLGASS